MEVIRLSALRDCLGSRDAMLALLGAPLASLVLRPDHPVGLRPRLGLCVGGCSAVLTLDDRLRGGCLAEAFLLPVRWRQGQKNSRRLPLGLGAVALEVRAMLGHEEWGLGLDPGIDYADFSELPCEFASAWMPLAAGLEVAVNGGAAQPTVFASGRWIVGQGPAEVDRVEEKITAIDAAVPTRERVVVFVPEGNRAEARRSAPNRVDVRAYPTDRLDLRACLAAHLATLHVPPGRETNLNERLAYANQDYVRTSERRAQYYLTHLVDDLAERLRPDLISPAPLRVAFAIGTGPAPLANLLVRAVRGARVGIIRSVEAEEAFQALLEQGGSVCQIEPFEYSPSKEERLVEALADWLSREPREECRAVEITGGTKAMSAVLIAAAQRTRANILYMRHETANHGPLFGTETITTLDWLTKSV